MNRNLRLREDAELAIILRKKLEQWLINTNPNLVQKRVQTINKTTKN